MPNCPVPNCLGAKLSGWQIVHFYYSGAKLSVFIILVPNCLFLLSWCQVVRFIILEPNCPVLNCLVPNCPLYYLVAKLSGAKLSGAKLSCHRQGDPKGPLGSFGGAADDICLYNVYIVM